MLHVMHLMSVPFVSISLEVLVPQNANFSPKGMTREQSRLLSKYYSVWITELVEHNNPRNATIRNDRSFAGVIRSKAAM